MRSRNEDSEYESDQFNEGGRNKNFRPRGNFNGGGSMRPPVQEGEEIEVTIEAIAAKGDGLAKKDGFVIFVPGTSQGQKVKIKITRVLRRLAFAEVVGAGSASTPGAEPKKEKSESSEGESSEEEKKEESDSEEESSEEGSQDSEDF